MFMKKLLIVFAMLPLMAYSQWTYHISNSCHIVAVPAQLFSTVCGVSLESGDVIGGFYDSSGTLACAGYIELTGVTTALPLWGDDPLTADQDGFLSGELINWKVLHDGQEYLFEFGYMDPSVDPSILNTAWWFPNGISALNNTLAVIEANAEFSWGFLGDMVCFFNESSNYNGIEWDFGDGTTSFEINPTHFFEPGSYPVKLICLDDCDGDTAQYDLTIMSIPEIYPVIVNEIWFDLLGRKSNFPKQGVFIVSRKLVVVKGSRNIPY